MAVPPKFEDLGKVYRDLLSKEFPSGFKLEVNSTTATKQKFTVTGSQDRGPIKAEIKAKYTDNASGLTLTPSFTTDSVARIQAELKNYGLAGSKVELNTSLNANSGKYDAKLSTGLAQDHLNLNASFDLFNGPVINADLVTGAEGFFVGAETSYDVAAGALKKYNFAGSYVAKDFDVTLAIKDKLNSFGASYWTDVVPGELRVGAQATYSQNAKETPVVVDVAGHYKLDATSFAKFKVDTTGALGLSYTTVLRPETKVTLSALVDTQKLSTSEHKFGLSLTYGA